MFSDNVSLLIFSKEGQGCEEFSEDRTLDNGLIIWWISLLRITTIDVHMYSFFLALYAIRPQMMRNCKWILNS